MGQSINMVRRTDMKSSRWFVAIVIGLALGAAAWPAFSGPDNTRPFTQDFRQQECTFSSAGSTPYFILEPGYQTVFEGVEGKTAVVNTITVLRSTRRVDGVETRIVQERETHDGELVELSMNYFAICSPNNSVFYFGEDVDIYEGGVIVSHAGAWRAGVNGARAGIVMPGIVLLGSRYFQEITPGVALDRAEIVSMGEVVQTPAGVFERCVKTEETTPLEPNARESKFYAAGVGLVQDDTLFLARYGFVR
jgi:hypothetical protein